MQPGLCFGGGARGNDSSQWTTAFIDTLTGQATTIPGADGRSLMYTQYISKCTRMLTEYQQKHGTPKLPAKHEEDPLCAICRKHPNDMDEYVWAGIEHGCTPVVYLKQEEQTLNRCINAFWCTQCYVDLNMPPGKPTAVAPYPMVSEA